MNKISDLIKERVFIVNKEHLTKEDYERIAEIEIEISEIKKSGKDNKVPTKKTNFEKIKNMSSKEFAEKYAKHICDIGYCEVEGENACPCYELCAITPCNEFNGCKGMFEKWLESEVE